MLSGSATRTVLPVLDIERARRFYAEKLGLTPLEESPGGLVYEVGGAGSPARPGWPQRSSFLLYPTPNPARAGHTQMGFIVDDIKGVAEELRTSGVVFEEYDFPGVKTENGVAEMVGGYVKSAWFKDSEGNLLGLVQFSG
ncbi:MAG TPA: VOC family protein [Candidatus Dormibacteraeota bacterium]|nr:VOC family protein [Candidatus Dormibacteraeota bacterium]